MKYSQKHQKIYHDFFKTKLCPDLQRGCQNGENCNFAHSEEELRQKPNLIKTKICEAFQQGKCNLGDECQFAHDLSELRWTDDLYKTSLCYSYNQTGQCQNGDQCRYAHGINELRSGNDQLMKRKKQRSHQDIDQNDSDNQQYSVQNLRQNSGLDYQQKIQQQPVNPYQQNQFQMNIFNLASNFQVDFSVLNGFSFSGMNNIKSGGSSFEAYPPQYNYYDQYSMQQNNQHQQYSNNMYNNNKKQQPQILPAAIRPYKQNKGLKQQQQQQQQQQHYRQRYNYNNAFSQQQQQQQQINHEQFDSLTQKVDLLNLNKDQIINPEIKNSSAVSTINAGNSQEKEANQTEQENKDNSQ